MATATRDPAVRSAGVVGIVGGALLVIGSLLDWAKLSIDLGGFAQALGVDPGLLQGSGVETSLSVKGTDADGKITLFIGVIVLVCTVVLLALAGARKAAAIASLVGGVIGAGIGILDILTKDRQIDDAIGAAAPQLSALGISTDTLRGIFDVSWQVGIYLVIFGGALAIIAGIVALRARSEAGTGLSGVGAFGATSGPSGMSGFETPPPPAAPPGHEGAPSTPPPPVAGSPTPLGPPTAPTEPTGGAAPTPVTEPEPGTEPPPPAEPEPDDPRATGA
jgi:hypothetical protein